MTADIGVDELNINTMGEKLIAEEKKTSFKLEITLN
jgi:hypothetical protein